MLDPRSPSWFAFGQGRNLEAIEAALLLGSRTGLDSILAARDLLKARQQSTSVKGGVMLGVNVGCGATATPGWVNFDNSLTVRLARTPVAALLPGNQREFAKAVLSQGIRWADATSLPMGDETADVIYSSHMLEHMSKLWAAAFLDEAHRVLKLGGVLRLALPDLRVIIQEYLETGDADRLMERSLLSNPLDTMKDRLMAVVVGTRHHQWMYDGPSLVAALTRHGFRDVVVLPAGETAIPDAGALDLREREEESVYVEGVK